MPLIGSKEVSDDVKVALLVAVLVLALRYGSNGKDASFSTATVFEGEREGDAGSGRLSAMNVDVASISGDAVGTGVEHSNKESLDIEDQVDVLLVPVVTPLGYGNEVFAVQLHAMINLLVGFPISLYMFNGAYPISHIL